MGVKNVGCGCLTLIVAWASVSIIASMVKGCIEDARRPLLDPVVDTPQATADFVKEQLSKSPKAKKKSSSLPTGGFEIDLLTKSGSDKRFTFNIKGRNKDGDIQMSIKEVGGIDSVLGGMLRLNLVYWDPSFPDQKGLTFQVLFNDERGCFIRSPEKGLKTVYVANKERFAAQLTSTRNVKLSPTRPVLKKTRTLTDTTVLLPENLVPVKAAIVKEHDKRGKPIETYIRNQHTR